MVHRHTLRGRRRNQTPRLFPPITAPRLPFRFSSRLILLPLIKTARTIERHMLTRGAMRTCRTIKFINFASDGAAAGKTRKRSRNRGWTQWARRRAFRGDTSMDTSVAATGKRNRGPEGVAENPDELLSYQDKRCRVGDLHLASDVGKEVVKEHARRRYPESKSRSDVTQASAAEGVGAAISARVAEECNRVLAQDLTGEGEELNRELVDATHCVAAI